MQQAFAYAVGQKMFSTYIQKALERSRAFSETDILSAANGGDSGARTYDLTDVNRAL